MGAFFSLGPVHFSYGNTVKIGDYPVMKERILPVSITWDVANLMSKDVNISWKMIESISEKISMMVSGSVLEKGKKYVPEILDIIDKGSGWDDATHPKVALVAGWLVYREIVPMVTPVYQNDAGQNDVYKRDIAILKYRIARANGGKVEKEEMEDILKMMFHRATFRTHTITPDSQDWENWVVRYLDWYNQDQEDLRALAGAWLLADDGSMDTAFFNPNDELIKIANDYSIWEVELTPGFLENKGDSLYAKTLANATKAVMGLDEYFKGNIDKQAFLKKLGI